MKIKICGMKNQQSLDLAKELGFDFCGFIFHEKSPRYVAPERAKAFETGHMLRVGVFVQQEVGEIMKIMRMARLDMAQLHGPYSRNDAMRIGRDNVIRALWPECYENMDNFQKDADMWADASSWLLLDAGKKGGGSGRPLDWEKLTAFTPRIPWFLAGGLGPDNLDAALCLGAAGLDFNSGLENAPGQKDHVKMKAAIGKLKNNTHK